jgi:manganese transport protein
MYQRILAALDHSPADENLLAHVTELARLTGAVVVLVHVTTGWAVEWRDQLNLAHSAEMREDEAYLEATAERLHAAGLLARFLTAAGDPPREILKLARSEGCDLIALSSHGHRFLGDLFLGATIDKVRHESDIPILAVPAGSGQT